MSGIRIGCSLAAGLICLFPLLSQGQTEMDHGAMDHQAMDHEAMDPPAMDHKTMDPQAMDHQAMDHQAMDHQAMDHSAHAKSEEFDEAAVLKVSQAAIGSKVGDYVFHNQNGEQVRLSAYLGKPLVVSMIYTSCYHICPTTTQHLAKVVKNARGVLGAESFNVLSIGFDTHNDTSEAMREFARQQNVSVPGWDFLSADEETIKALSQDIGFQFYPTASGFDHMIQASVLDAQGEIYRQVYGMTFNMPVMVDPLKELVFGQPADHSFFASLSNKVRLFCTVYDPATEGYHFDYSLFVGIIVGFLIVGSMIVWLIREWRHARTA